MVNKLSYKLCHFHGLIAASMEAKQLEDDLEAALLERDALKAELKAAESRLHEVAVGCANAEFELDAARKQEPVGWMLVKTGCRAPDDCEDYLDFHEMGEVDADELAHYLNHGRAFQVYASPVPAQQPADVTPGKAIGVSVQEFLNSSQNKPTGEQN